MRLTSLSPVAVTALRTRVNKRGDFLITGTPPMNEGTASPLGEVVDRIVTAIRDNPKISRRELSRQVCEWLDWRDPLGKLCEMSARMALQGLHRRAAIVLPAATSVPNFKRKMANMNRGEIETASVGCSFKQLGAMEIIAVSGKNREQSAMWTRMLEDYHYLGAGRLRGAQMRYLIRSPKHGLLGAASFSAVTRAWRAGTNGSAGTKRRAEQICSR